MRLSLSVPDDLWLRACETCPATPPSRLVQAALEHLVAGAETGYAPGRLVLAPRAPAFRLSSRLLT